MLSLLPVSSPVSLCSLVEAVCRTAFPPIEATPNRDCSPIPKSLKKTDHSCVTSPAEPRKVLIPTEFQHFVLKEITAISHNVAIYRFALPRPTDILGLPIGQHISLAANIGSKEVVRSYTPISSDNEAGYFDLLVKAYPEGNISKHLTTLKVGQAMKVRGPKGAMVYTPNMCRHIGMIAGGTGITPMLQVIEAIIRNRPRNGGNDTTKVDLIFANVNHEDILLKEKLDKLAKEDEGFNVYYVLNNPPEGWTGGVGFVTPDMIKVCNRNAAVLLS
jgi:cytochrome-b5 reductase